MMSEDNSALDDIRDRLGDRIERLKEALTDLLSWTKVLHQNSVCCAQQHHGDDFSQGTPGWLADSAASIERARTALKESDSAKG